MTAYPITVPRYERIGRVRIFGNRYRLNADWTWETAFPPPGKGKICTGEKLRIQRTLAGALITIDAEFEWDGATMVPDFWAARKGSLVHDALYRNLDSLVMDYQCELREARWWADAIFNEVNTAFGLWRTVARLYFRGVRWLGGIARRWSR